MLWHVAPADREAARQAAARLRAPGRASLEVAEPGAPESALVIPGPPAAVGQPVSLASALAALTGGAWREPAGLAPLAERLARSSGRARVRVRRCSRTRARRSSCCARRAAPLLDAGSLSIEAVFLDGREVGGGR